LLRDGVGDRLILFSFENIFHISATINQQIGAKKKKKKSKKKKKKKKKKVVTSQT
jgi:hypothetical protein